MKKSSKISDEDKKRFRDAIGNVKPMKNDNIISEKPKPSTYQKKDKLLVNEIDYSGYPDCRPEFIESFEKMINLATKRSVEGKKISIHTHLINLTKSEIIKKGSELEIDYSKTLSCYSPDNRGHACGICDSCRFRKQGFLDAGIIDPTRYKKIEK